MNASKGSNCSVLGLALLLPATGLAQDAGQSPATEAAPASMDHSKMDHSKMDHSKMDHSKMDPPQQAPSVPREPIPPISAADRAAAFPEVHAHHRHGTSVHSYWLLDRLEATDAGEGRGMAWEGSAWIGGDVRRLWLRSEGHAAEGEVASSRIELLYGQGVRAWWDVLAGVRHDVGAGPSRTWAALGVQGLAPYKFELSATAYLGQGGRTAATVEAEYDTLLGNRLILQWRAEANLHGRNDPVLGIGSGLGTLEAGARLRYEIDRRFAPYLGLEREWSFGATAGLRRGDGAAVHNTRIVAGVRAWW